MSNKIKSEIIKIDLNEASYKGSGTYIEPTYVNFFFGNNGSGKSTIARAIKNSIGITYSAGKTVVDYIPLVYDQTFIDENFKSYHNMPGVFTLNKANAEVQQRIDELNAKKAEAQKAKKIADTNYDQKVAEKEKAEKDFYALCWNREEAIRKEFPETQKGKKKSAESFANAILSNKPEVVDMDELKRLYESAFSASAKHYSIFNTISDIMALDSLEGREILTVAIVNSADTELASFLRDIGATEWMKHGHTDYTPNASGRCPYCGRPLEEDFEETVIKSFDDKYQKNLDKLNAFLESYKKMANDIFMPLQKMPAEIYPKIEIKAYEDKLKVLKATIQGNIDKIKSKIANPSIPVSIEDINPLLSEINEIIKGFNTLIQTNNVIVVAKPAKQAECTKKVFSLMAYQLKDCVEAFKKTTSEYDTALQKFSKESENQSKILRDIANELKQLRTQTVETETAKDSINLMLRDSGMQGFSLQPKQDVEHVYEVRRPNGSIATDLSEGEKNFIAFLYFYHLVLGSNKAEGDTREKIVVIDDPVSSMDSNSLFIVSTLVQQLIEICRNNADNRDPLVKDNFIKQIFILTHNSYFYREIVHSYIPRYEYVSIYLIKKSNSKSTIKLCEEVNPKAPSERINANPIKNSYYALWDEYNELTSGVPLMNVIRRILEYYFLQICGYTSADLRQAILVDGKKQNHFKDADGNIDEEKFQLASSMLAYINSSSLGMNEGLDYVEDFIDVDVCKNTFKLIFDIMNQKQHYEMMMAHLK